jgi:putative holliday junction resolvase
MPRLLGIDFGKKRIGIAVSDALGITVNPVSTIYRKSFKDDIAEIKKIISEKEADKIVIGMPYNADGTPGFLSEEINKFAEELKKETSLNVEFVNEELTSHDADNILIANSNMTREKRKEKKDQIAACLILRNYMERNK